MTATLLLNYCAVGYRCCCRLLLLLPVHTPIICCEYLRHTAAAQIACVYILYNNINNVISQFRSIQVELGKVEISEKHTNIVNANHQFKCKAASSLTVFATSACAMIYTVNIISLW